MAGLMFGDGAAPAGAQLTIPQGQALVQTRWPSGSPKHVVLAGTVSGGTTITPAIGITGGANVDGPARIAAVGAQISVSFEAYRPFASGLATVSGANADRSIPVGGRITLDTPATWPSTGTCHAVLLSNSSMWVAPYTRGEHNGPYPVTQGSSAAEAVLTNGAPLPQAQADGNKAWLVQLAGTYSSMLSAASLIETFWEGPAASYYKYQHKLSDQYRVWWYVMVLADGQVEVEPVIIKGSLSRR